MARAFPRCRILALPTYSRFGGGRRHRDDGHNGEACRQDKSFQFHELSSRDGSRREAYGKFHGNSPGDVSRLKPL